LIEALERELNVKKGQTTPDNLFGLDTVNCVGCCGLAPVITVGKEVHGKVKIASVPKMIKQYRPKEDNNAPTIH
jgi:NADH:ubiquinone oxidoreductase subunit E